MDVLYPASWIGGYYLTTPWVAYLGCFYNVTSFNDDSFRYPDISSAACLLKCDEFEYFTLEFQHCRCLNSKKNLHTTDPEDCKSGKGHNYFDVYKTINLTKDSPRGSKNQELQCTIIQLDKKTKNIYLKATKCNTKHSILCESSEKELSVIDNNNYTFAAAKTKCTILDYYLVKNSPSLHNITFEEKSYWTNVLRFSMELWVDNTTDIDVLRDRTRTMRNQRCLLATVNEAGYPPAVRKSPCNNVLPFRCSPAYTPIIKADTLNTSTDNVSKNTEQTTDDLKGTDNVSKTTEQTTEDSKVSMYAGTAVALTILPVAVVVLAVCIRRHRTKVVVMEPAAIDISDDEYENVQENVNTDYHTLNLDLVGETNDYSTLQPNVPDYIELR